MWSLFKNRTFWIVWLSLSLLGGAIGLYLSNKRNNDLENADIRYVYEFREDVWPPSIIVLDREKYQADYSSYFQGTKYNKQFRFTAIPQGQKVHVLEYTTDSLLAKIAVVYSRSTMRRSAYSEYWIWHEYLTTDSTYTDPFPIDSEQF